jgi:hypothetical protein
VKQVDWLEGLLCHVVVESIFTPASSSQGGEEMFKPLRLPHKFTQSACFLCQTNFAHNHMSLKMTSQ